MRTFSIGFELKEFDESSHAAAVANHLGTRHTAVVLSEQEAWSIVPELARIYDEPFADSSQIPTILVSRLARGGVTVALTGDGGDELFWGYGRYPLARKLARIPSGLRAVGAAALAHFPLSGSQPSRWNRVADRARKLACVLGSRGAGEMYATLMSVLPESTRSLDSDPIVERWSDLARAQDMARMSYVDQCTYLPDDVLVKVDRASMSVSLESRVPLLDRDLVEFAWRLPPHFKLRDGTTKWLMRQLLYRHVPRELVDRPKSGFAVPLERWLRGPLREWLMTTLSPSAVREAGWVEPRVVETLLSEHMRGTRRWHAQLWSMAMLHAWSSELESSAVQEIAA